MLDHAVLLLSFSFSIFLSSQDGQVELSIRMKSFSIRAVDYQGAEFYVTNSWSTRYWYVVLLCFCDTTCTCISLVRSARKKKIVMCLHDSVFLFPPLISVRIVVINYGLNFWENGKFMGYLSSELFILYLRNHSITKDNFRDFLLISF